MNNTVCQACIKNMNVLMGQAALNFRLEFLKLLKIQFFLRIEY